MKPRDISLRTKRFDAEWMSVEEAVDRLEYRCDVSGIFREQFGVERWPEGVPVQVFIPIMRPMRAVAADTPVAEAEIRV